MWKTTKINRGLIQDRFPPQEEEGRKDIWKMKADKMHIWKGGITYFNKVRYFLQFFKTHFFRVSAYRITASVIHTFYLFKNKFLDLFNTAFWHYVVQNYTKTIKCLKQEQRLEHGRVIKKNNGQIYIWERFGGKGTFNLFSAPKQIPCIPYFQAYELSGCFEPSCSTK